MSLLLRAGVVLGIGLGSLADGIVLHQVAQWHHLGSAVLHPHTIEAMRQNMLWDGWFHIAAWLITLAGVFMLWRAGQNESSPDTGTSLIGEMIFGWGLFNLAEGFINHHVLGIHHVRDMPVHMPMYDWMFLSIGGLGFAIIGLLLTRSNSRTPTSNALSGRWPSSAPWLGWRRGGSVSL